MPVATRNVRNKTARSQGLGSLVDEVSASQPAPAPPSQRVTEKNLPRRQPKPKTPVHRSSQNSLPTPQTTRVSPPAPIPAVAEEEEEDAETQTQTQPYAGIDYDKELEELDEADVDRGDSHSLSSLSSEGRLPPPSAQRSQIPLPTQASSTRRSLPQPELPRPQAKKTDKGKAAVSRDEIPTAEDLRRVTNRFQITVDKQPIHTARWLFGTRNSFDGFAAAVRKKVQEWLIDEMDKDGINRRAYEVSKPIGELNCWGMKKPLLFILRSDDSILTMQEEVYRLVQEGKRNIELQVTWGWKT